MDCVVAPFDQRYELAELAVKVTVCPCVRFVEPLTVIVAVGILLTLTTVGVDVAEQLPLLTVTEYEPAVDTVIDFVVFPFDHK